MKQASRTDLQNLLDQRFSDAPEASIECAPLVGMAGHGSCRAFQPKPVDDGVLQTLCAVALTAPSKSDLQQRDIIVLRAPDQRAKMANLVGEQTWVANAPMILVFCGNNRRQRFFHDWHNVSFANDHLDAFFNATTDAAIALGAFVTAAEAVGLGCCPISAVRNNAASVSNLLELPDHVFPVAGLAVGYPVQTLPVSKRLPLSVTVHEDRYSEQGLHDAVMGYDADRAVTQPYAHQRDVDRFGRAVPYTWSIDKVRQYNQPERDTFGVFVRAKGFCLD